MRKNFRYILTWFAALVVVAACNKPLVEANSGVEVPSDTTARTEKVLLILIDGAVGDEYRSLALPTLKSLEQNSIFSYDGLNSINNEKVTLEQSWSSIMTGVTSAKHNVTQSLATNNFGQYPSFLSRLKQVDANFYSVAIAANTALADNLFTAANEKFVFANNDGEVNNKAKSLLAATPADVVVVHFNSPNQAGLSSSYTAASPAYVQAAQNVDGYIKQQIAAVQSRPAFAKENWMIMIVSTTGSNLQNALVPWSAFEDKNHNTLYFFFNPRFQLRSFTKPSATSLIPYQGTTPTYLISGAANNRYASMEAAASSTDLNFGTTGDFTVQCKIKTPTGGINYPSFFGKRASFDGTSPGWLFFFEGNGWGFNVSQGGGNRQVVTGTVINDNKWHTLTGVVKLENGVRTITSFTDGVKMGSTAITGWNLDSPSPFSAGWRNGSNSGSAKQINITDIRIYNAALPDAYISSNFCRIEVPTTDTYYNNLIGFWPSSAVFQDPITDKYYLKDESPKNRKLIIAEYAKTDFYDSQFGVCPPLSEAVYKLAPLAVDVASQIYSWLGVPARPSWNLDGKSWVPNYSNQ